MLGCGFGGGAMQQSFCQLYGLWFKAIRGDLYVLDECIGLVNLQRYFHASPWETGFFSGLELLPATEKEIVWGDVRSDGLHFAIINKGVEV